MKKVLLVIDNLGSGGAQNQLTLLAVELKNAGYDVTVFTYFPHDFFLNRLVDAKIDHVYCLKKGLIGLNVVWSLRNVIKLKKISTIISFLDTPNFYAALAKRITFKEVDLITSYRSMTNFSILSWSQFNLKKWVNRNSKYIVSNSYHESARWVNKSPFQLKKWRTIYNAVDHNKFFPDFNYVRNDSYLVVGSVSADKNGLLLIEAMKILRDQKKSIKLHWIGQKVYDIQERKEYLEEMENKIRHYNLENSFTWGIPNTEVEEYYRSHKALILASKTEGLPNVVCEALSCGTPCIVSNILDHPKIVIENENGFLFEVDSAQSLVNAIIKLENLSKVEYHNMSENAYHSAITLFNKTLFKNRFMHLIEN